MNHGRLKGRPREFEMDVVLDAMVDVFWDKGYEGTSLSDILDATGLQKGSLYKAFRNKQEMFREALQRYITETDSERGDVMAQVESPLERIEVMLRKVVGVACGRSNDYRGCLAVRSMMDRTSHDTEVVEILKGTIGSAEKRLTALIDAGQAQGEIRSDLPAKTLAESLYCFTSGMLATARIATNQSRLDRLVEFGVAMLQPPGADESS